MRSGIWLVASLALWTPALAGPITPEQQARCAAAADEGSHKNCLGAYEAPALVLPSQPEATGNMRSGAMAIHKPSGNGPFPAVILMHTCGGIDGDQMIYWIRQSLQRNFVAFVLDSYSARGMSAGTCTSTPTSVPFPPIAMRVRDAYEALAHLGTLPFVDAKRISAMGFSHGGRVAFAAAGEHNAATYSPGGQRFHSLVSVYGRCFNTPTNQWITQADTSTPILSLLGDKDEDGNAADCLPRFNELKAQGRPIEWHVYPGAAHAWDQVKFIPGRKVAETGIPGGYAHMEYDQRVTEDSTTRAFAFMSR
jgi:dienelactone hydrolase